MKVVALSFAMMALEVSASSYRAMAYPISGIELNTTYNSIGQSVMAYPDSQSTTPQSIPRQTLVGYWHNFENPSGKTYPLSKISKDWDVINVAFAVNNGNGNVGFNLDPAAGSEDQFIADVAALRASGKIVSLSLGGQDGSVSLGNPTETANFVSSVYGLIQKYGFDGIDVDLENGVSLGLPIINNLISAIKQIKQKVGPNFYLSMAPEHPYVQGGYATYGGIWGSYLPIIDGLREDLTQIHVQFYNNGGFTYTDNRIINEGTVDCLVGGSVMLIEGFKTNYGNGWEFKGLRPDQVAFGVPSGLKSAGRGQVTPEVVRRAITCLAQGVGCDTIKPPTTYPTYRGVMTWSINWDSYDGFVFSRNARSVLNSLGGVPPTPSTRNPTQAPTQSPTQAPTTVRPTQEPTKSPTAAPTPGLTTSTPTSTPSTSPPSNNCGKCTNCYYQPTDACFSGWTAEQCASVAAFTWCERRVLHEWAIYQRNFGIFDLDWSRITHVNYAFGKPNSDGSVGIYDGWAAVQKRWPDHGDSWNDQGNNLYGNFGQGNKLKKQFRGTKFGLSIGGWTLSDQFSGIASTEAGRRKFAKSSVDLMLDLGLDFIDIDWEYPVEGGNDQPPVPHHPDDMKNFVALLAAIRDEFKRVPFKAELSVASPAGPANYRHWDFPAVCGLLDHINIMTYDLAGSWSQYTDHQANLYEDPNHPVGAKYSAHGAVQDYIKGGCPSEKIVLGIPAYGRSFEGTNGLYANFTKPTKGSWVAGNVDGAGVWDYKALPLSGATEFYDEKLGAAFSYDPSSKIFTSYESPKSLATKLDYIKKYNLGGTMFWSGDADATPGSARSLITQVYNYFGKDSMAFEDNNLDYPTSQYANVRNNSSPVTTVAPTTGPTKAPTPAPTTTTPTTGPTKAPTPAPTTTTPTTGPTKVPTPSPTGSDKCDGNTNTCYWPATQQKLPYSEADCKLFSSFVWCP